MSHELDRWQALRDEYIVLLLDGSAASAIERTRTLLAEGVTPLEFFQQIITPALAEVGRRFEELEIFLPELAIAGEMVKEINDAVITPALAAASQEQIQQGKVILGTVQGDLHDIGKNMVGLMLGVHGFDVIDLGTNVPPAEFVQPRREGEGGHHRDVGPADDLPALHEGCHGSAGGPWLARQVRGDRGWRADLAGICAIHRR